MKRKILPVAALFTFLSSAALAQSSVQVKAGVNLANISVTDNGDVNDNKQLTSFNVGILGDIPLVGKFLSFQPGIVYTGKGATTTFGNTSSSTYYEEKFNPRYIEIPANLVFKLPFGDQTKLFAGAGPYLGIGIGGKSTVNGQIAGIAYNGEQDIDFSNDDPTTTGTEEGARFGTLRRFDYGLNGTAGFETNTIVLSANYGYGLAKLQSGTESSDNDKNKHRVLSFSIGYKF